MARFELHRSSGESDAFGDDGAAEAAGDTARAASESAAHMPGCNRVMPGPAGLRAMADSMRATAQNRGAELADVSFLTLCAAVVSARQCGIGAEEFAAIVRALFSTPMGRA